VIARFVTLNLLSSGIDISLFNAALSACESASAWQMVFEADILKS
jgi:hypothetical protein